MAIYKTYPISEDIFEYLQNKIERCADELIPEYEQEFIEDTILFGASYIIEAIKEKEEVTMIIDFNNKKIKLKYKDKEYTIEKDEFDDIKYYAEEDRYKYEKEIFKECYSELPIDDVMLANLYLSNLWYKQEVTPDKITNCKKTETILEDLKDRLFDRYLDYIYFDTLDAIYDSPFEGTSSAIISLFTSYITNKTYTYIPFDNIKCESNKLIVNMPTTGETIEVPNTYCEFSKDKYVIKFNVK